MLAQFVSEASATLKRRSEGTAEDVWLKSNLYPDYYLNTFHFQVIWVLLPAKIAVSCVVPYSLSALPGEHACTAHRCKRAVMTGNVPCKPGKACKPVGWTAGLTRRPAQTDGWLSEQSAKVYEVSTETLFLGRQDAMQRQTLVPLHKYVMSRPVGATGLRALEIAAGTGRFATFTKVTRATNTVGRFRLWQHLWKYLLCFSMTPDSCVDWLGPGLGRCCAHSHT